MDRRTVFVAEEKLQLIKHNFQIITIMSRSECFLIENIREKTVVLLLWNSESNVSAMEDKGNISRKMWV